MVSVGSFGGNAGSSTRPYLIRALHDWCTDNGFTPYIAVYVDRHVQVPMEYVKANEIVLNVGFEATSGLTLGNETIEFKARFGGSAREIVVPIDHVIAIYARENGQGMAFPVPNADGPGEAASAPPSPVPGRAALAGRGSGPADPPADANADAELDVPSGDGADAPGRATEADLQLVRGSRSPQEVVAAPATGDASDELLPEDPPPTPAPTRPALKRVK